MNSDISSALRPAVVMLLLFTLLTGLAYPAVILGIGQLLFPAQANGSLVRDAKGAVVGSELIGQGFAAAKYFHGRPSAAGKGYDGQSSGGSNFGPNAKGLIDRVKTDAAVARKDGATGAFPADMLTASGSGLDPHISPATAYAQVDRVAKARGLEATKVKAMVDAAVEGPLANILGEPRVNVLKLNRQLDAAGAQSAG
ncbi:potassium-transporting ATPase subunit KdpC [Sphingosinicellaceae bacterium]|nr:potassium-transporting ATPase subunit KdpC [Sphingosinicellaceae bacterium]